MEVSKQKIIFLNLFAVVLIMCGIWWANTHLDQYYNQILNLIAINAILALSLNLVYGFTGLFSLGHAGFMALGAYVTSILILSPAAKESMWILEPMMWPFSVMQLPFPVALILGGLVAAFFAILIGIPVLRLGGDYLGIATLGFAEIIRVVLTNITPITNGALGIKGIPDKANLWWNWGMLIFTVYFIVSFLRSNYGNVLKSIREDVIAAKTMGVNTFYYQLLSFVLGAFFAGIGGGLAASLITTIDPKQFTFLQTFNVLMIVIAGGLGSITGSIVGSIVITVSLEWLRLVESPGILSWSLSFPDLYSWNMIYLAIAVFTFFITRRGVNLKLREKFSWLYSILYTFFWAVIFSASIGWLSLDQAKNSTVLFSWDGIPGMRMVIFAASLLLLILFRRQGLLGHKEFSWEWFGIKMQKKGWQ